MKMYKFWEIGNSKIRRKNKLEELPNEKESQRKLLNWVICSDPSLRIVAGYTCVGHCTCTILKLPCLEHRRFHLKFLIWWQISVSEVFKEVTLEMQVTQSVKQQLTQATSYILHHKYPYRPTRNSNKNL